jgi:hypothetical protein
MVASNALASVFRALFAKRNFATFIAILEAACHGASKTIGSPLNEKAIMRECKKWVLYL